MTVAMSPFSRSSPPTFGPTISTRLTSKFPVPAKAERASSPISFLRFFVELFIRIMISLSLPNFVTLASLKISLFFSALRIAAISTALSYRTCTIVPPAKSIPKLSPLKATRAHEPSTKMVEIAINILALPIKS